MKELIGIALAVGLSFPCLSDAPSGAEPRRGRMDRSKLQIGAFYLRQADDAHLADARDCGIDFFYGPPIRDRAALDRFAAHGLGVIPHEVFPLWSGDAKGIRNGKIAEWKGFTVEDYRANLKAFVDGKMDHPAIWMLDVTDEPSALDMPYLGDRIREIAATCPDLPVFCNLYPSYARVADNDDAKGKSQLGARNFREYVDIYCRTIPLDYISYDFYPYHPWAGRRAQLIPEMFAAYEVVARACRRTGRSFWYVPQVNAEERDGYAEDITVNKLRFQAYTSMAFGAETIIWACYSPGWWTRNVLTKEGEKTAQYERLKTVNAELHAFGPRYMKYWNVATHLVGFADDLCKHAAMPRETALNLPWVRGVRERGGHPLTVGEMEARANGATGRALFVVASGDPFDVTPVKRTVTLRPAEKSAVRIFGAAGELKTRSAADGTLSFDLFENNAALVVTE